MTYPDGKVVEYKYDRSGLLTEVIDFSGKKTVYKYDANRRVISITRPNGTSRTAKYNVIGQIEEMLDKDSGGSVITTYNFTYDAAGNIVEEKQASEKITIPSGTITLEYGKGNRLIKFNGQEVKYDADGNMIYGPLGDKMVNFTYDARNRLIQAGSTTYLYAPENNRIGKIENGQKTTYVVNANNSLSQVLMEKKGDRIRSYIYGLGLIMHVEGGEYATYHYDYRGSTVAITNSKGKVTDTFTYGPYAELIGRTGKSDISFLFNGRDGVITDANGLYYMRARYYNPTIKRFINQDVVVGTLDEAIILNRYAYAGGDPVSYIDPFGLYYIFAGEYYYLVPDNSTQISYSVTQPSGLTLKSPKGTRLTSETYYYFMPDLGVTCRTIATGLKVQLPFGIGDLGVWASEHSGAHLAGYKICGGNSMTTLDGWDYFTDLSMDQFPKAFSMVATQKVANQVNVLQKGYKFIDEAGTKYGFAKIDRIVYELMPAEMRRDTSYSRLEKRIEETYEFILNNKNVYLVPQANGKTWYEMWKEYQNKNTDIKKSKYINSQIEAILRGEKGRSAGVISQVDTDKFKLRKEQEFNGAIDFLEKLDKEYKKLIK